MEQKNLKSIKMNKKNKIKNKLINHLLLNGNKKTCESILLKSLKNLQKDSTKSYKKIIKLAVMNSALSFRINKLKNKRRKKKNSKEVPTFILNNFDRISWSLKFILATSKKKSKTTFFKNLQNELILNSQNKGNTLKIKTELHKQVLLKKRLFLYFRW